MKKLEGKIVSVKMNNTVVVEIVRKTPHPLYRKIIKRSKNYKVDSTGFENLSEGNVVKIIETRPISKTKYFKVSEIINKNVQKTKKIVQKEVKEDKPEVKVVKKTETTIKSAKRSKK